MKAFLQFWLMRSRYPHAVAAGVLLALAFPNCEIAGLAWVAPALLLGIAAGTDSRHAFRIGYIAGLAYHLTSLYWLLLIPVAFFPILGWLALSAYLSLYTGVWVWAAWRLWPTHSTSATDDEASSSGLNIAWPTWIGRAAWAVGVAALWVALELIRSWFLGGFPLNLIGASQFKLIPLIQLSSFTGVYGVSFLVIWFSAGLLCAGLGLVRAPARRMAWLMDILVPLLAIAVCFNWGMQVLKNAPSPDRFIDVALVQPSIPQATIWDESEDDARFAEVLNLSEKALAENPDLLLWPEAAIPKMLRWDEATYTTVTGLAESNEVWMIIGADDAIPGDAEVDDQYFNCSWLIHPEGRIAATYRKQRLVAFGEEVPFNRWLPFLKWLTPITGSFTPGTNTVPFKLDTLDVETATLICFEDIFPSDARKAVTADTDFLVNLTNDGWFREGALQRQQAASAIFRAVENGVPLIRCTNNGRTCWVDRFGRIVETFTDNAGTIYGSGYIVFHVPLSDNALQSSTFYTQNGDVFAMACVALSVALCLASLVLARFRASS